MPWQFDIINNFERLKNETLHHPNNSDYPMLGSMGIHWRFAWLGSLT